MIGIVSNEFLNDAILTGADCLALEMNALNVFRIKHSRIYLPLICHFQRQCVRLLFLSSCLAPILLHFFPLLFYILPISHPSLFRSLLLIFPSHHALSPFCLGRSNLEGNPGVRRQTTRRAASRRPGDNFWKVNRASGGAATGKSNLVSSCGFVTRECGEAGREGGCYDIAVASGR